MIIATASPFTLTLCAVFPLVVFVVIRNDGTPQSVMVNGGALVIRLPLVDEGKHAADAFDLCLGSGFAFISAVFPLVVFVVIRNGGTPQSVMVKGGALVIRLPLVDEGKDTADAIDFCLGTSLAFISARFPLVVFVVIRDGGTPRSAAIDSGALVIRLSLVDEGKDTADAIDFCLGTSLAFISARFPLVVFVVIRDGGTPRSAAIDSGALVIWLSLVDEGKDTADAIDFCLGTSLAFISTRFPLVVFVVIRDGGTPRSAAIDSGALVIRLSLVDEGKDTADAIDFCLGTSLAFISARFPLVVFVVIRDGGTPRSAAIDSGALVIRFSLVDEGKHTADACGLCVRSVFTSLRLWRSRCGSCRKLAAFCFRHFVLWLCKATCNWTTLCATLTTRYELFRRYNKRHDWIQSYFSLALARGSDTADVCWPRREGYLTNKPA